MMKTCSIEGRHDISVAAVARNGDVACAESPCEFRDELAANQWGVTAYDKGDRIVLVPMFQAASDSFERSLVGDGVIDDVDVPWQLRQFLSRCGDDDGAIDGGRDPVQDLDQHRLPEERQRGFGAPHASAFAAAQDDAGDRCTFRRR